MKKAREYAGGLAVAYSDMIMSDNQEPFGRLVGEILIALVSTEITELREMRRVKTDAGLIPIFKEQRQKFNAICNIFSDVHEGLISVDDFDNAVKDIYPSISDWYKINIINQ